MARSELLNSTFSGKHALVLSDTLGEGAGSHVATWFLCRQLCQLGIRVSCFATWLMWAQGGPKLDFEVIRPWVLRGCRWDWPGRCLAWQLKQRIRSASPDWVFVVGLTPLARYLLKSEFADQAIIWELTNATAGNKHVDFTAVRLLSRCRAVLSPSPSIDQNIRLNYGYDGRILRLPFWIEETVPGSQPSTASVSDGVDCGGGGMLSSDVFETDFIFLGRRDKEKGLHELIRATAAVVRHFPNVRVLITGQGSDEPYARLARELQVDQNITLRCFPSRADTLAALARSRCLVLPSYHEGYPLVLLEAAQSSVPFIATRVGSVPDLFGEATGCEIIPPKSEQALAAAMLRMLCDSPESYAAKRIAARGLYDSLSSRSAIEGAVRRVLHDLNERE